MTGFMGVKKIINLYIPLTSASMHAIMVLQDKGKQ